MTDSLMVWCDTVVGAAKGKTAGTFDSLGTITLKKGAKEVLGVIVNVAPSGVTVGENGAPVIQLDSDDLGISKQRFTSPVFGDGVGSAVYPTVESWYLPYKSMGDYSLDNAKIDVSISGNVNTTAGWSAAVGIVYANGEPDDQFSRELMSGISPRATGGAYATKNAGISSTSATAFSNTIDVTSRATELIGILSQAIPNAGTAGEEVVGYTELQASQINDFSPQKWPFAVAFGPPIGTINYGIPVASYYRGLYWPTRFPLPKVNFSINVSQTLAAALTNAADGLAAVKWR